MPMSVLKIERILQDRWSDRIRLSQCYLRYSIWTLCWLLEHVISCIFHSPFCFLFFFFWQSMPRNIHTVNAGSLSVKKSPQLFHYFIAYGAFFKRTSANRLSHSGSASKSVPKWNVHTFFAATKQVNTQLGSGATKASCRRLCCLAVVIACFCLFVVRNELCCATSYVNGERGRRNSTHTHTPNTPNTHTGNAEMLPNE